MVAYSQCMQKTGAITRLFFIILILFDQKKRCLLLHQCVFLVRLTLKVKFLNIIQIEFLSKHSV